MPSENTLDYRQFYDIESYLFNTVRNRFSQQGYLSAFDFFCIVIWKANRAKSKIAKRLLSASRCETLEEAVRQLTKEIATCSTAKERFKCLLGEEWGLRLPMATAILTVLYPDEFTIYDWRVCEQLDSFRDLVNMSDLDKVWEQYSLLVSMVRSSTPSESVSLRDKDRYLFGKSFCEQLERDIKKKFRDEQLPDPLRQNEDQV